MLEKKNIIHFGSWWVFVVQVLLIIFEHASSLPLLSFTWLLVSRNFVSETTSLILILLSSFLISSLNMIAWPWVTLFTVCLSVLYSYQSKKNWSRALLISLVGSILFGWWLGILFSQRVIFWFALSTILATIVGTFSARKSLPTLFFE